MGAPPPTRMAPMDTCTEERRVLLMGMRPCVVRILPLPRLGGTHGGCYHAAARISLFGESPARAGTPKAQIPPGNAQAPERQTAETAHFRGASGERWIRSPPTEGERRLQRLISQVTGQKGGRRHGTRALRLPPLLFGGS